MLHQTPPGESDAPALTQRARLRPHQLLDRARRRRDEDDSGFSLVELMAVIAIGAIVATVAVVLFVQGTDTAEEAVITSNFNTVKSRLQAGPPSLEDIDADDMLKDGLGEFMLNLNAGLEGVEVIDINAWMNSTDRKADQIGIWANPLTVRLTGGTPVVNEDLLPGSIIVLIHSDGESTRCIVTVTSRKFPSGSAYMHVLSAPKASDKVSVANLDGYAHCGLSAPAFEETSATDDTACKKDDNKPLTLAGAANRCLGVTDKPMTLHADVTEFHPNLEGRIVSGTPTAWAVNNQTGANVVKDSMLHWTAVSLDGTNFVGGADGQYARCLRGWPVNATADATSAASCPDE